MIILGKFVYLKKRITFIERIFDMLTIYSSAGNAKRLEFVSNHLFNEVLGTEFQIVADSAFYRQQTGTCINYSAEPLDHGLQIFPQGLLSESNIHPIQNLQIAQWNNLFCFFHNERGDIPFDLFAATFYLLSLYEEYFPTSLDEHGRFDPQNSLLFQNACLEIPIIDRWAYQLKETLENSGYSTAEFRLRKYRAISTYDIDFPFLYRYKGLIKSAGALLRDCLKQDFEAVKERLSVLLRRSEDPYMQAIRFIHSTEMQAERSYYLFVLLGKRGKLGRSAVYSPKDYYRYLKELSAVSIGLHPSYETYKSYKTHKTYQTLISEKNSLEKILQHPIAFSRQHFLRMLTPDTFQALLQAGIREDFTLAFANAPGFRSGTAVPHFFYDLQKEEATSLLLRPTVMMDSSLIINLKLSPEAALDKIKSLIDACKESGGDYLSLWHNSNIAGSPEKNPWIRVFIESHRYATFTEND